MSYRAWFYIAMGVGFAVMAFGLTLGLSHDIYFPGSVWGMRWFVVGIVIQAASVIGFLAYSFFFHREEWQQRWQARPRMSWAWWAAFWALFALWFAASRYERAHREYSFLTGLLWTVVLLMIMTQTLRDQRQSPRSRRLLSVLFAALAAVNIGLIWRGLDTDLRYCIGQTYYQKTPIDSFGCDIVKAIP